MIPITNASKINPVAKKAYIGESILSAVLWGITNFIFSLLDDTDFATSCLSFPGFITVCMGYKFLQMREKGQITKKLINDQFFRAYYNDTGDKLNMINIFHMIIRSVMFFALTLLAILAAGYALKAQINFGIITSCICISIALNAIFSYIFYQELLTKVQILGISVIIVSIVGISIAKGSKNQEQQQENGYDDDEKLYFKIAAISLALIQGICNCFRAIQAKYLFRKTAYQPVDLSVDSGLFLGISLMICSIYYWIEGCDSYTWYNFFINIIGSHLMMIFSIISLKCIVKGLAGTTSAIIYSFPVYTSILQAIFLKQIPSLYQILASFLSLIGVGIILLGSKK
ncbi:UNKNOWN [Stylonychia lemnae]|uniref:Uncharacterized protein n=1 Tax=Stylonychia lemnae TaxID=5949 RepID=A0A078AW38_STYLE|nr:UNKNOWN [Stylonychia lemnae]|eukprot:CDW85437.1 UNKNOWN [Stylonychia lemnae]